VFVLILYASVANIRKSWLPKPPMRSTDTIFSSVSSSPFFILIVAVVMVLIVIVMVLIMMILVM